MAIGIQGMEAETLSWAAFGSLFVSYWMSGDRDGVAGPIVGLVSAALLVLYAVSANELAPAVIGVAFSAAHVWKAVEILRAPPKLR